MKCKTASSTSKDQGRTCNTRRRREARLTANEGQINLREQADPRLNDLENEEQVTPRRWIIYVISWLSQTVFELLAVFTGKSPRYQLFMVAVMRTMWAVFEDFGGGNYHMMTDAERYIAYTCFPGPDGHNSRRPMQCTFPNQAQIIFCGYGLYFSL